jgi:hypothetical protein
MKTIFRINSIRFDEKTSYLLRKSSDFSRAEKRDVKAWYEAEACWYL